MVSGGHIREVLDNQSKVTSEKSHSVDSEDLVLTNLAIPLCF